MKKSKKRHAILPRTQYLTTLSVNMAHGTPLGVFTFLTHFVARGSTRVKTNGSEWISFPQRLLEQSVLLRVTQYLTTLSLNMAEWSWKHIFKNIYFCEFYRFILENPWVGLPGGLWEPWAPKFPDSAQPLQSLVFIKEYR